MIKIKSISLSNKDKIKGIILPNRITSDLAYLCGILAGDGHINIREEKHDWLIKCVGNPKNEAEFYHIIVKPLFKRVFGLDLILKPQDSGETYGFCTWSRAIVTFLTEIVGLPYGNKYSKLKIPEIFVQHNLIKDFIKGVADTDFYLGLKRGSKIRPIYPVISGVSKSKNFIDEIATWLNQNGFHTNTYERKQIDLRFKKGYSITHVIELSGHENFIKWMEIIGFNSPKHRARAEEVFNSYKKVAGAGLS